MPRILIVSADSFLRDLMRFALAGLGAELRIAATDEDAARALRRSLFDLVVLLPASPYLCCGSLPRRPQGLRRPVVYVIAWQQTEQAVLSLLECGVDQYMTLPLNLARLRRKVTDELNRLRP